MDGWKPIVTQIWATVVRPGDCCGQVVPRQQWVGEVDGEEHHFCREGCERLYGADIVARQKSRPLAGR